MCVSTSPEKSDVQVPLFVDEMLVGELFVQFRPFLFEFLNDISSKYELILYSSLNRVYVEAIIANVPKLGKYFAYIFGDDYCVFANLDYGVKCLDFLLDDRNLGDILLVDKTPKSLPHFPYNFLPAPIYGKDNLGDRRLITLGVAIDHIMTHKTVQEGVYDACKAMQL
eukprot:TRINITY_DN1426_c0_g1_i2.p1 TRINITY_DN1426_c0_g1~~TRINITY_DN1426_c0_g1_i2.p1  ORF type:complete len:168 (-),score=23.53 TRINITY_DN1426_c0_g1_i2:166-669(-)